MKESEKNSFNFVLNLTKELALDYDKQHNNMESFARWNLPEEIGLEWIDAECMIDILYCSKIITQQVYDALKSIVNGFILEFEKNNNPVWTHEQCKNSDFWNNQRKKAKEIIIQLTNERNI